MSGFHRDLISIGQFEYVHSPTAVSRDLKCLPI